MSTTKGSNNLAYTPRSAVSMGESSNAANLGNQAIRGDSNTDEETGCCYYILIFFSYLLILITLPFSLCVCYKIVQNYERAVIYRLGRLDGAKGPGLFWIVPCVDSVHVVDLRTVSFDIPPQEILTKDSVTVAVDAVVYYHVMDPAASINNVENSQYSTKLLAQTTLRNILGTKSLAGILSDREEVSHNMQTILDTATDPWGIKIERVELKDVRLPNQMQRAMAAEAEASRDAKAKIISARGELDASRALKEAADIIGQSKGALQLRYLQTLTTIAAERNSTIIFPLPMDIIPKISTGKSSITEM